MARAYAAVVVACNGSSWLSGKVPSMDNLVHLRRMAHWLERVKNISDVTRVCLVAGYAAPALQRWASDCDEIVDVPMARLVFWKRQPNDHVWAKAAHADSRYLVRGDGRCTSLKFEAWLLTRYKGGVLVSDADVCLHDDPLPYMRHAYMRDEYFVASPEKASRSWTGLNTHLMFLRPSEYAHRLLRDKAARGAFLPFTNTEQDVLETVFAPANRSAPKLPRHFHSSWHVPGWDGRCDDERARSRVRMT